MKHQLSKPINVLGATVATCEDAAYRVRQQVIGDFDAKGAHLVRFLREADTQGEIRLAEGALKTWLQERAQLTIDVDFVRLPSAEQYCKR